MNKHYPESLLDKLQGSSHWNERYKLLITAAKELSPRDNIQLPEYNITGCAVKTWVRHYKKNDHNFFEVDSESKIIKGLALLLADTYNDKTLNEMTAINIDNIFQQLDFKKHLSQSRSNGFYALQKKMLALAVD